MKPLFEGLVVASGEDDSGKTTFCTECGPLPEQIAFINDDLKGKDIKAQIEAGSHKFGFYIDLIHETSGMLEIKFHEFCVKMIDAIPDDTYEAIIWDTWSRFETTFHPYVLANQKKFRETWSAKGDIHGAQIWQSSFEYESLIIDKLLHKCKTLLLTTHLKDQNINGKKTGLQIPDNKKPLVQKAQMRIFLRHNPDSEKPIGLVLKRIARVEVNEEEGLHTIAILPRRINPCTWKKIRWYWHNPVADRKLEDSEKPNEYELALLDGTLTADMKMILKLEPVFEEEEETPIVSTNPETDPDKITEVKQLKEHGKNLKEISDTTGIKVPAVMRMLNK